MKRKVPVPPIEWCDEAWVKNKFGVPPDKIIDLLGLMGDSVDNIPGAPGIGEKGALKLVLEYGSASEAMENADKVTHKTYRESLQNNQEIINQSLELATIHCEVPIELDLEAFKALRARPQERLRAFSRARIQSADQRIRRPRRTPVLKRPGSSGGLFDTLPAPADGRRDKIFGDQHPRRSRQTGPPAFGGRAMELSRKRRQLERKIELLSQSSPHGICDRLGNGEAFYIDLENFNGGIDSAIARSATS